MLIFDEKQLADYLEIFFEGRYRQVIHRFFRAKIQSVLIPQYGSGYLVTVQRTNDTAPDDNTYRCNIPGYVPQVGDDVELVWRDGGHDGPGAAYVFQPILTAQATTGAGGALGYAQVTAAQGGITTAWVDLTGLTLTVTVGQGRRIKITGKVQFYSSVNSDLANLRIVEGTTDLQEGGVALPTAGYGLSCVVQAILTPTAGTHTYKLQGAEIGGLGAVTMNAASNIPAFILVEDLGG